MSPARRLVAWRARIFTVFSNLDADAAGISWIEIGNLWHCITHAEDTARLNQESLQHRRQYRKRVRPQLVVAFHIAGTGQDRQSPHATYSFTAQVAAAHTWLTHTAVKQSLSTEHVSPESHPEQTSPPQSTSVSAPFCAPSSQAIRSLHTPSPQDPEAQSLLCTQARPSAHAAQSIPPQSISVSTPFCSPSPHTPAANWQLSTPPRHTHAPSGVQIGGLWLK